MTSGPKNNVLRSIGAVFVGILANILIAVPLDAVLHSVGVYPPMGEDMSDALFGLALSYRILAALVGGYLCAKIAPQNPMKHAIILGCIGIVMSSSGAIMMWDMGHQWYPLTLVAISLPCSYWGAKFQMSRS